MLLNNTSHDEVNFSDPWEAVIRSAIAGSINGANMVFQGQELGISDVYGYDHYETNFGKQIPHFKRWNSMQPIWQDADFGNNQLYNVYSGILNARKQSSALKSSNRYFLYGDGNNDMPGLSKPINYWEIMNEPEFNMFFKGTEDEFVEIFNFSSKLIREKQKDAVIVMAGAAGMFPENKKFWKSALPKIKDHFDIANIHHITPPEGKCDKEFWVDEFAGLLKSLSITKPIWVTEAMTGKCKAVPTYIKAFASGAEVIIDVGVNAPGMKMSKKERKKLNQLIEEIDGFKSVKLISKNKAEFEMSDGSTKTMDF